MLKPKRHSSLYSLQLENMRKNIHWLSLNLIEQCTVIVLHQITGFQLTLLFLCCSPAKRTHTGNICRTQDWGSSKAEHAWAQHRRTAPSICVCDCELIHIPASGEASVLWDLRTAGLAECKLKWWSWFPPLSSCWFICVKSCMLRLRSFSVMAPWPCNIEREQKKQQLKPQRVQKWMQHTD